MCILIAGKSQLSWWLVKEFRVCSHSQGLEWRQWVEVMRDFNKCASKYILQWHWLWPWALDHWCGNSWCEQSPRLNPPSTFGLRLGVSHFSPFTVVTVPCQPGFRERKLSPSFSFQTVCSLGDQDCHISLRKAFSLKPRYSNFSWNPYKWWLSCFNLCLSPRGLSGVGEPYHAQCPGGLSADSLSFTLAFWGPESVMGKQRHVY